MIKIIVLSIYFALNIIPGNALLAEPLSYYVKIAEKKSPILLKEKYGTLASKSEFKSQSLFLSNPAVSIGQQNSPLGSWPSVNSHPMSGLFIGVSQTLSSPWADHFRKKRFFNLYLSQKERQDQIRKELTLLVASTYHKIHFLYLKRDILIRNMKTLKEMLALARAQVEVNKMNSSQLLKIGADISIIDNNILEVEGETEKAQSNMDKLCGIEFKWNPEKEPAKQWLSVPYNLPPVEFKVSQHPFYKRIKAKYMAQKAAVSLEKAKLWPSVKFSGKYTLRQEITGRDEGEDFVSLSASIPIPLYYPLKERHLIDKQKEREREMRENLKDIFNKLRALWKGEKKNFKKLSVAFYNFKEDVIPNYWAVYKAQMSSLSAGTIKLIDVLDTYRMYLNAELKQADLFKGLQISRARLSYLIIENPKKTEKK